MQALHNLRGAFDPDGPSWEISAYWTQPGPGVVFSILLLVGGDVVSRTLAQLAGSGLTPVALSFGWASYASTALVSAIGEKRLMPTPDCACQVINASSGYVRDNSNWILSRIVRDFEDWADHGKKDGPIQRRVEEIRNDAWESAKARPEKKETCASTSVEKPLRAGLCVSVYEAGHANIGYAGSDWIYWTGFGTILLQLGIAAIPYVVFSDSAILLITVLGNTLSLITGSLSQWTREKWACRQQTTKITVLTKGNGSQHAIVVMSKGKGLDLEDLATSSTRLDITTSVKLRIFIGILAGLWILLLIVAAGIQKNTGFLLAIGALGTLQNVIVAGVWRYPKDFGVPLEFNEVIADKKVMPALYAVESKYPRVGRSMLNTFFPGMLREDEEKKWKEFEDIANAVDKASKS